MKKQKSNWINERRTEWENHDKICWAKSRYGGEDKKAKDTRKYLIKIKLKFEN